MKRERAVFWNVKGLRLAVAMAGSDAAQSLIYS